MSSNDPLERPQGSHAVGQREDGLSVQRGTDRDVDLRDDTGKPGMKDRLGLGDRDNDGRNDLRERADGLKAGLQDRLHRDDNHGANAVPTRGTVVAREKEAFGGIKVGSAFFGWLAATGMAVLLTAIATGAGTAFGLATDTNATEAVGQASQNATTVGITGAIVLLVILFVAYYCGGYVAGRMARFNGAKQGVAVWLWAVAIAIVVAIVAAVAGTQSNILADVNGFPRIPVNEGDVATSGIVAAVVAAVAALVGAVLGGLAGMRYHRKVDKAGFGH